MARGSLRSILGLAKADTKQPHEQFLQDLIYTIEWKDPNDSWKPSMTYKPSSMACLRNMFYQRSGADTDLGGTDDYQGKGMGESGTDRHSRLQNWICQMKNRGIDCEYYRVDDYIKERGIKNVTAKAAPNSLEFKCFHKDLQMSFMTDGILRYKGVWYILEIKTEIAMKWYKREDADSDHKRQAAAYCYAFGIDKVIFLYENRDMLTLKSYLVTVDQATMQREIVDRIGECEGYVKRGVVPPRPEDANCRWCPYQERCHKDGK